jgi:hypothetical protein
MKMPARATVALNRGLAVEGIYYAGVPATFSEPPEQAYFDPEILWLGCRDVTDELTNYVDWAQIEREALIKLEAGNHGRF